MRYISQNWVFKNSVVQLFFLKKGWEISIPLKDGLHLIIEMNITFSKSRGYLDMYGFSLSQILVFTGLTKASAHIVVSSVSEIDLHSGCID